MAVRNLQNPGHGDPGQGWGLHDVEPLRAQTLQLYGASHSHFKCFRWCLVRLRECPSAGGIKHDIAGPPRMESRCLLGEIRGLLRLSISRPQSASVVGRGWDRYFSTLARCETLRANGGKSCRFTYACSRPIESAVGWPASLRLRRLIACMAAKCVSRS